MLHTNTFSDQVSLSVEKLEPLNGKSENKRAVMAPRTCYCDLSLTVKESTWLMMTDHRGTERLFKHTANAVNLINLLNKFHIRHHIGGLPGASVGSLLSKWTDRIPLFLLLKHYFGVAHSFVTRVLVWRNIELFCHAETAPRVREMLCTQLKKLQSG